MHGIISGVTCGALFGLIIVINIYKQSDVSQGKFFGQINSNISSNKILLGPVLFLHSSCTLFGLIIGALYHAYIQKFEYGMFIILIFAILLSIFIGLLINKYSRSVYSQIRLSLGSFIVIFGLLFPIITK